MPSSGLDSSVYSRHQNSCHDGDYSVQLLAMQLQQVGIDVPNQWNKSSQDRSSYQSHSYAEDVRVPSSEHVAEIVGRQGTYPIYGVIMRP